ncbi:amphi-Trp domain-containing protein [Streptomyces sp. TLI_105]|uniref:amphi-Trp domain-containing protein n=1 Tax=Streptomyces sp. TLI_105 TaxID=1881019 RepID=UPI00089824B8|nr:amphi-Trp domain-containing protein [Streptomyces sp. TLI_105]SEC14607.1 amphi-Trp domain-containing protein [Streptomyces sp. TLI_105]
MKDLKFEQKRSVSRLEAAEQLMALATALKNGGEIEWNIGHGKLSLNVPDELQSEIEIEVGEGGVELEIELEWSTAGRDPAPREEPTAKEEKPARRKSTLRDSKPARAESGTRRSGTAKRSTRQS